MTSDGSDAQSSEKRMKLRYAGVCRLCGTNLPAHQVAIYEKPTKTVRCLECQTMPTPNVGKTPEVSPAAEAPVLNNSIESGVAGASARREYERRSAKDEARLREKWGRFGGIAVALSSEKQSTTAWATGATGEELLGTQLDNLVSDSIAVLHDRRIPGTRANIDHIVITSVSIWVIDAKRYQGRPNLQIEGGIFRPRVETLFVGRRNCTKLVDGVHKQIASVQKTVGDLPVTGALCFIDADWPLVGSAFTADGIHVLWPRRLYKLLRTESGTLNVPATRELLAERFKPA